MCPQNTWPDCDLTDDLTVTWLWPDCDLTVFGSFILVCRGQQAPGVCIPTIRLRTDTVRSFSWPCLPPGFGSDAPRMYCTIFVVRSCTVIIVRARTMMEAHACTMIIVHACTIVTVHACALISVHTRTIITIHACNLIIVHASTRIIIHACAVITVYACSMVTVHAYRQPPKKLMNEVCQIVPVKGWVVLPLLEILHHLKMKRVTSFKWLTRPP